MASCVVSCTNITIPPGLPLRPAWLECSELSVTPLSVSSTTSIRPNGLSSGPPSRVRGLVNHHQGSGLLARQAVGGDRFHRGPGILCAGPAIIKAFVMGHIVGPYTWRPSPPQNWNIRCLMFLSFVDSLA